MAKSKYATDVFLAVVSPEIAALEEAARAARIEVETYINLRRDIITLLDAYEESAGRYKDYYQGETSIISSSRIWTAETDLRIPSAGGVRGMLIGGELETRNEKLEKWMFLDEESGLYLRGYDREEQRSRAKEMKAEFNKENPSLLQSIFDPSSYVSVNAIRRVLGLPLLDERTSTRFLDMADVSREVLLTPRAGSRNDRQLWFYWSANVASPITGSRFSVEKKSEA